MILATIGVPRINITFRSAADAVASRLKNGVVALIVRDGSATAGLYPVAEEADIPSAMSADNAGYVKRALMGSRGAAPSKVYVSVIGTDADLVADGAAALSAVDFDYLAGPPDLSSSDAKELLDWLVEARKSYCIGKLVAAGYVADNMACINFGQSTIGVGVTTYTGAQYCSRIAGILASTDLSASATYAPLPEVTSIDTISDPDAAVDAGKLILLYDGRKAKIARAVNSMTKLPEGVPESLKKCKMVEAVDLIRSYALRLTEDSYVGIMANTYDNKLALVTDLQAFLSELEAQGVLVAGSANAEIDYSAQRAYLKTHGVAVDAMTTQEILEADTGSQVFVLLSGTILDAMEDFSTALTIGGNS